VQEDLKVKRRKLKFRAQRMVLTVLWFLYIIRHVRAIN